MKIALVIPAKETSCRIKHKNLATINQKSLIQLACEKALLCKNVQNIYIDTESDKIISAVAHLFSDGLGLIRRPKALASNETSGNDLMCFECKEIPGADLIVQTFATSPLISAQTIDRAIEKFLASKTDYDSFFSVTKCQEYFWDQHNQPVNFSIKDLPNSYELPILYQETHGFYGVLTDTVRKLRLRVGSKPMLINISKLEALDINEEEDLILARSLLRPEQAVAGQV